MKLNDIRLYLELDGYIQKELLNPSGDDYRKIKKNWPTVKEGISPAGKKIYFLPDIYSPSTKLRQKTVRNIKIEKETSNFISIKMTEKQFNSKRRSCRNRYWQSILSTNRSSLDKPPPRRLRSNYDAILHIIHEQHAKLSEDGFLIVEFDEAQLEPQFSNRLFIEDFDTSTDEALINYIKRQYNYDLLPHVIK